MSSDPLAPHLRWRRLMQLWAWLPAFRVVAETQHLPTASKQLGISASALSRTVKLLEEAVDRPLFHRAGRNLELSPAGALLLTAVRNAMRGVDDALEAVNATGVVGPVRISAPGPYSGIFILPALERMRRQHPDLLPHVISVDPAVANEMLLAGTLDLAIHDASVGGEGLSVLRLGELTNGVYAGRGHPLYEVEALTLEELLEHPFVGPPLGLMDHWPGHISRKVGMVVSQMNTAVQVCAAGSLLATLPDAIAEGYPGPEGSLRRLPIEVIPARTLYAVCRSGEDEPMRTEVVLNAIGATVREACKIPGRDSVRPAPPDVSESKPPSRPPPAAEQG